MSPCLIKTTTLPLYDVSLLGCATRDKLTGMEYKSSALASPTAPVLLIWANGTQGIWALLGRKQADHTSLMPDVPLSPGHPPSTTPEPL